MGKWLNRWLALYLSNLRQKACNKLINVSSVNNSGHGLGEKKVWRATLQNE
jgi:hypothetical protein